MDEENGFEFGERVEIGGRTMLRPGFSLVGLTGTIWPTAPNAPAGCQTVAIDWPAHGYTEENGYPDGSLPLFLNVPTAHLTLVNALPSEPEPAKAAAPKTAKSSEVLKRGTSKTSPKADDDPEGERPRLRLV